MFKTTFILLFLLLLFFFPAKSQIELEDGMGYLVNCKVVDGDTIAHINLREVIKKT